MYVFQKDTLIPEWFSNPTQKKVQNWQKYAKLVIGFWFTSKSRVVNQMYQSGGYKNPHEFIIIKSAYIAKSKD